MRDVQWVVADSRLLLSASQGNVLGVHKGLIECIRQGNCYTMSARHAHERASGLQASNDSSSLQFVVLLAHSGFDAFCSPTSNATKNRLTML